MQRAVDAAPAAGRPLSRPVDRVVVGLLLGAVALHLLALGNPDLPLIDCEERYNAGHAYLLAHGHLLDLFRLQYRDFCGGCTVVAALGAPLFALLPPTFFVWKLLSVGLYGLAGLAGAAALLRRERVFAARAFALLWMLPPWNFLRLSLLSWGNHLECGLIALAMIGALDAGRPRRAGLWGGLGLWVGFSMAPLLTGCGAALAARRDWGSLRGMAPGLLLAPVAWGLQYASAGTHPFGTIYVEGESTPSFLRGPAKLVSLLAPQQLAGLFGLPRVALGAPLGLLFVLGLVAALWALRRGPGLGALAAGLLGGWLAAYLVVGFTLEQPPWPIVASPAGLRYAAPLYPAVLLVIALGAEVLGGRRGWLLLGPALLTGALARGASLSAPFPSGFAFSLDAVDVPYFRVQASYALPAEGHAGCMADDALSRRVHAYAAGRRAAASLAGAVPAEPVADWAAGVGGALIDAADPHTIGSLRGLQLAYSDALSLADPALRGLVVDEAVWRRVYREKDQSLMRGALRPGGLAAVEALLGGTAPPLRSAIRRAWGRRWARVEGRTGQPSRLLGLPAGDEAVEEGLGIGLGEEWGPAATLPSLPGLRAEAAFRRGYARGVGQLWSGEGGDFTWGEGGRDAGADRWWGPAPPMLCPCGATCE